jgi:hypothetical protein
VRIPAEVKGTVCKTKSEMVLTAICTGQPWKGQYKWCHLEGTREHQAKLEKGFTPLQAGKKRFIVKSCSKAWH